LVIGSFRPAAAVILLAMYIPFGALIIWSLT
jgi:hypothetical protein